MQVLDKENRFNNYISWKSKTSSATLDMNHRNLYGTQNYTDIHMIRIGNKGYLQQYYKEDANGHDYYLLFLFRL